MSAILLALYLAQAHCRFRFYFVCPPHGLHKHGLIRKAFQPTIFFSNQVKLQLEACFSHAARIIGIVPVGWTAPGIGKRFQVVLSLTGTLLTQRHIHSV